VKKGEKHVLWAIMAALAGIVGLTAYLENNYQQHNPAALAKARGEPPAPLPATSGAGTRMIPRGLNPAALPDPDSRGATLLTVYCAQCHELPTPLMHAAAEWPAVLERMQAQIQARRGAVLARVVMPPERDWHTLRDYLLANAQRSLDESKLGDLDSPAGQAFRETCSQCHAAPAPGQHRASEWPRIVLRMKQHMQQMGRTPPDITTNGQIVNYLQRHAAAPPAAS